MADLEIAVFFVKEVHGKVQVRMRRIITRRLPPNLIRIGLSWDCCRFHPARIVKST